MVFFFIVCCPKAPSTSKKKLLTSWGGFSSGRSATPSQEVAMGSLSCAPGNHPGGSRAVVLWMDVFKYFSRPPRGTPL